jgi:hypothetical protein
MLSTFDAGVRIAAACSRKNLWRAFLIMACGLSACDSQQGKAESTESESGGDIADAGSRPVELSSVQLDREFDPHAWKKDDLSLSAASQPNRPW